MRRVDLEAAGPVEAFERVAELQAATGRALVHPFEDPLVLAGAGTVGLEIEEDAPDADAVIVPVGGGGLIGGIQTAIGATMRVIAVEPETSNALHAGIENGRSTPVTPTSIADGLNAPFVGALPLEICRHLERVLVTEDGDRGRVQVPLRADETRLRAGRRRGDRGVARAARVRPSGRSLLVSGGNVAGETAAAILARR